MGVAVLITNERPQTEVKAKIREVPMSKWMVLQTDRLPAYITWDHYLANQERLRQNRFQPGSVGAPREGKALLTGILVCGCLWAAHARVLSKQVDGVLRLRAEEARCLRLPWTSVVGD